jgi:spermidine synthase
MRLVILALFAFSQGAFGAASSNPTIVFETTSVYHHIRVIDEGGLRTLKFDGAPQTKMALLNPLQGHFEYIEYFQMPWLWNSNMTNVLMVGLGGGSAQRLFHRYSTNVTIETVEIDPVVVDVARGYFQFTDSPRQKVHVEDGRVFLRRSSTKYGAIIMDAYVHHRYGSAIPYQLATKEFFELARAHLTTNGVMAYNVISMPRNTQADLLGSIYKTMKMIFPQVYMFPAQSSQNVVLIATTSPQRVTLTDLQQRAGTLLRSKKLTSPSLWGKLNSFKDAVPLNLAQCNVLTDDFAPVDGLLPAEN